MKIKLEIEAPELPPCEKWMKWDADFNRVPKEGDLVLTNNRKGWRVAGQDHVNANIATRQRHMTQGEVIEAKGLVAGDIVKVLKQPIDINYQSWRGCWYSAMDEAIITGKSYQIQEIDVNEGYLLKIGFLDLHFPAQVCEKVDTNLLVSEICKQEDKVSKLESKLRKATAKLEVMVSGGKVGA